MGGTSQVSIPQVLMVGDLYLSADVWYATPLLVLVCPEEKVDVGKKLNTNVSLVGTYFFALLLALRHIILGGQKVGITFCSLIFSEPCTVPEVTQTFKRCLLKVKIYDYHSFESI